MPPIQKLISFWGLAKQSAKGVPAANATYGAGALGGQVFDVPIDQEPEAITLLGGANDRFAPAVNRTGAHPAAGFSTRVWPRSIGLFLLGALGTDVVTGSGPYSHALTPALDLPYLTLFAQYGTGEREKLPDCKVDELVVSWSEANPLEAEIALLGLVPTLGTGAFTITNDETAQTFIGPTGGTFLLDVASATPVAAQVKGASIRIANNLAGIPLSKSILPDDVFPGLQIAEGTITLVPNDLTDWRKAVGGAAGATSVQESPVYGSFDLKCQIDANTFVQFAAGRSSFLCPFPEADPGGGPAELELAFFCARLTGAGAAFTATVKNAVASY
jgi:tail tube protein